MANFKRAEKSVQDAIFHYEAEVKGGKAYAIPILDGLRETIPLLEAYENVLNVIYPKSIREVNK